MERVIRKGPPSWVLSPIRRFKDRIRMVYGRTSDTNYLRLFPNPGFLLTVGSYQFKYSLHRGYSYKKVKR